MALEDLPWNLRLVNRKHPLDADFEPGQPGRAARRKLGGAPCQPQGGRPHRRRSCSHAHSCRGRGRASRHLLLFPHVRLPGKLVRKPHRAGRTRGSLGRRRGRGGRRVLGGPAGASEHQTGLAVDIMDADYLELDEGQESTATQQWLMAHCTEYGFILRYPTDKSATIGIGLRALALPLRRQRGRLRHSGKRSLPRRVARRNVPRPGLKPLRSFSATAPFRSRPLRNLPSPKPRNKNAEPSHKKGGPKAAFCKEWVSQELTASRAEQS